VQNLRDKEMNHQIGAADLTNYLTGPLTQMAREEDDKNAKYEEML